MRPVVRPPQYAQSPASAKWWLEQRPYKGWTVKYANILGIVIFDLGRKDDDRPEIWAVQEWSVLFRPWIASCTRLRQWMTQTTFIGSFWFLQKCWCADQGAAEEDCAFVVCTETAADAAATAWIRTWTSWKERQNYLPTYFTMQLAFDRDIMLTSHLPSLLLLLFP